ncbi:MAG: cytochrome b/b6 domain-containing protein [Xanthomonadales bacterium]|jgi:cytochrome b561|nr:cytochrome b/b6 domain-containing protein [Xanthomonadales bacterium]
MKHQVLHEDAFDEKGSNDQAMRYPPLARWLHLGLAVFGIAAYLTAEFAEHGARGAGYLVHAYLGLSLAAVMTVRLGAGLTDSDALGFRHWHLFSRTQWRALAEDLRGLLRLRLPNRLQHEGLSLLVQAFGLTVFAWMAFTGVGLYLLGGGESEAMEVLEELHEVGESLVPAYLLLHVGAVTLHTLAGHRVLRRMMP